MHKLYLAVIYFIFYVFCNQHKAAKFNKFELGTIIPFPAI